MGAPGTTPQTVADVLDAAADLLTPRGAWVQDWWGDGKTCFCLAGAIIAAGHGVHSTFDGLHALGFDGLMKATRWNDDRARSEAEVIAKLREAAQLARQGQPA